MKSILSKSWPQKPPLGSQLALGDPINQGLVGYWLMNEGAGSKVYDLSGNGNVGTFVAGTAMPTWSAGKWGSCLYGDGGDYLTVPSTSRLSFTEGAPDGPCTFSAWANLLSISATQSIVAKYASGNYEYALLAVSSTMQLRFRDSGGYIQRSGTLTAAAHQNQWVHYCGIYDGSGVYTGIHIYLNGVLTDSSGLLSGTYTAQVAGSSPVRILGDPSINYVTGLLDNLRIYNRVLSAAEIARLYREPFAGIAREPIEIWGALGGGAGLSIPIASHNNTQRRVA